MTLSIVAILELISACGRLQRETRLTSAQYQNIKSDLMADIDEVLM